MPLSVVAIADKEDQLGWTERPGGRVFSGHESFVCRYGWLPKLYDAVRREPELFASDERAIIALGLGRNMVKSIRFWGDAFGIIRTDGRRIVTTGFADRLLDPDTGTDPHLEMQGSLWRLHWHLTVHGGLGAWAVTFLDTHDPEITREHLLAAITARAAHVRGPISSGTALAHLDILLRTYDCSENDGVSEESLGSPFQELRLLRTATSGGVPTVRCHRGRQTGLDVPALAHALHDFWRGTAPSSRTLSLRSLMVAHASPGAVLMLDEAALHDRLEALCAASRTLALRSRRRRRHGHRCKGRPTRRAGRVGLVKQQHIAERVRIARRYVRAVELQRDLADPAAVDGYILTPSVRETTTRLLAGLAATSTQRAFRVVGPYGSGKSAFAVFLGQLLRDGRTGRAGRLWRAATSARSEIPVWEPLVLSGRRVSIANELLQLLSERGDAAAEATLQAGGACDARRVADILAAHARASKQRDGRGLLLLVDEMGRFLEHAAGNIASEDPAIFQELAERAGGAGDASLGIVAFMHHRFADYVSGLGDWVEAEWARSAERYEELPFGESAEQSLFLLAHALAPQRTHDDAVEASAIAHYTEAVRRRVLVAPADVVSRRQGRCTRFIRLPPRRWSRRPAGWGRTNARCSASFSPWSPPGCSASRTKPPTIPRTGIGREPPSTTSWAWRAIVPQERGRRFTLAADALIVAADMSQAHRDVLKTIALIAVLEPVPDCAPTSIRSAGVWGYSRTWLPTASTD